MPSHSSKLDHLVTQWMPLLSFIAQTRVNSSHVHFARSSVRPRIVKSHPSASGCGVGPRRTEVPLPRIDRGMALHRRIVFASKPAGAMFTPKRLRTKEIAIDPRYRQLLISA